MRLVHAAASAALTLVALAVAGCGSDAEPPPAAADPQPSAAETQAAATEGESEGGSGGESFDLGNPISVPWRLAGVDGTLLEIRVAAAPCVSFRNVDVTESAAAVTITALAEPDPETPCPAKISKAQVTEEQAPTALAEPLGDRKLVHAAVADEWTGPASLGKDDRNPLP
jgi:hypothetical protein